MMSNGWTVGRKPLPIEPPSLRISYSLTIVTMDKDGVLKVACCRHCGNLNSSEELFDDFESLPDCTKDVAGFGESRRLAIGSLYCSTFKPSNYFYVYSSGPIGYGVSIDHLRDMAGILQFKKTHWRHNCTL